MKKYVTALFLKSESCDTYTHIIFSDERPTDEEIDAFLREEYPEDGSKGEMYDYIYIEDKLTVENE